MIEIFCGENRVKAQTEVKRILGADYEVFEGVNLAAADLPSLFFGTSLFGEKRRILVKDLSEQKELWEKLPEYLESSHAVIIWETKLDKRTATYKAIKDKVKVTEFALPKDANVNLVFDIFRTAKRDGKKAVELLAKIEDTEEPYMLVGLFASQAIKDFGMRQGSKEKRVLQELSRIDMLMKTTSTQPWLLLKSFLLRVSQL